MEKQLLSEEHPIVESSDEPTTTVDGLTPLEVKVVEAIMNRQRKDTWEKTAKSLGVTRRTMYEYRQNPKIQDAVQSLAADQLKIDCADVLKEVARKAKTGNIAAARLFLEQTNRFLEPEKAYKRELELMRGAFIKALKNETSEVQGRVAHELTTTPLS